MDVARGMYRFRSLLGMLAVAGALAAASAPARTTGRPSPPRDAVQLTVGGPTGRTIAPGFLGLSFEYFAIPYYAGTDPSAVNPVLVQLIRNLAGSSPPDIRIGGDSTDQTWWPAPGLRQPAGVDYALNPDWVATMRRLATDLNARLILGVNLEANDTAVAATEARNLVNGLGRKSIEALELGNEPELYGIFTWGVSSGPGRPTDYGFNGFNHDFTRIAAALPKVPLAAPALGAPGWFGYVKPFLADQPRVAAVTLHRYPLQLCFVRHGEPNFPTIPHLLAAWSTSTLARSVAAAVAATHAKGLPLRIDEINTISCGDVPAVAQSFASALWGLDILFQMAAVGVDGVNMHTFPGAVYGLFTFSQTEGHWQAVVEPEYYGLQAFAQAAPAGSRLLHITASRDAHLKVWAVRAPDHTVRIVAINEGRANRTFSLHAGTLHAAGRLARLTAPSLAAESGVTLAGQSFGTSTTTGRLSGPKRSVRISPKNGSYTFRVPAASAAVLTIPER